MNKLISIILSVVMAVSLLCAGKITSIAESSYGIYDTSSFAVADDIALMEIGADIRIGGLNGIRFLTKLNTDFIKEVEAQGAEVFYGTLIAPKDRLTDKELTFDIGEDNFVDIPYIADRWYGDVSGQIAGSLIGIKQANIDRDFVGRGYVKVIKDGVSTVYYAAYANSDIDNNTRSLAYIADAYKSDVNSDYLSQEENIKSLIDAWAEEYLPSVEELQSKYGFSYYSDLENAVTDVNNNTTLNADSDIENAKAGVFEKNGVKNVVLLKNVSIGSELIFSNEVCFNLGGCTLYETSNDSVVQFDKNATVDGRIEESKISKNITDGSNSKVLIMKGTCAKIKGGTYESLGVYSVMSMTVKLDMCTSAIIKDCSVIADNDGSEGRTRAIQSECNDVKFDNVNINSYLNNGAEALGMALYDRKNAISNCDINVETDSEVMTKGIQLSEEGTTTAITDTDINVDCKDAGASYAVLTKSNTDISNTIIDVNSSDFSCGLYVSLNTILDNSEISLNSSKRAAGVYLKNGIFKINDSKINIKGEGSGTGIFDEDEAGNIKVNNSTINSNTALQSEGIYFLGEALDVDNSAVNVSSDTEQSYGIQSFNTPKVNVSDSQIYADASDNMPGKSGSAISINGVWKLKNVTARGTGYGVLVRKDAEVEVDGGWYDSNSHGGFYFSQGSGGKAYLKNAKITNTKYWGKYGADSQTNDRYGSFYIGGGNSEYNSNISVYMDNCILTGADGYTNSGRLRDTDGENNNKLYLSNCVISKSLSVGTDNFLYIGKGNINDLGQAFTNSAQKGTIIYTEDTYGF